MGSILVPKMTSKSNFLISFEKRRFTKSLEIPNEIKHFFKTKSSFISFKSLTSLKTALKIYTWKACVWPQQNAFGKPFSLKKHEVYVTRHPEFPNIFEGNACRTCLSLGEMHFWQFWRKPWIEPNDAVFTLRYWFSWPIMDSILVPKTGIVFLPQQNDNSSCVVF